MGDHPRLVWPEVSTGLGMQSLLGVLEHVKDFEGTLSDPEKIKCAVDDARTVELAVVSKIYPGLPDSGPVIGATPSSTDIEAAMTNTFGDAVAAREAMEGIIREVQPASLEATPLAGLDWMALLMQFVPMLLEIIRKWIEGRE